ncbi:response regulator [Lichenicoccus sp.]|uniref:response regulator n=1 Tax=Lichenicoccus sp. TaxID=2781899 RepID=UPI003D0FA156
MAAHRLLLVEDEFLIRMTLAEVLTDDGFEVVEAEDGDSALALLASEAGIALMLTDIQLPGGIDGKTLAGKVREQKPGLPVIFMSGQSQSRPDPDPLNIYVNKPYSPIALSARVRQILDGA